MVLTNPFQKLSINCTRTSTSHMFTKSQHTSLYNNTQFGISPKLHFNELLLFISVEILLSIRFAVFPGRQGCPSASLHFHSVMLFSMGFTQHQWQKLFTINSSWKLSTCPNCITIFTNVKNLSSSRLPELMSFHRQLIFAPHSPTVLSSCDECTNVHLGRASQYCWCRVSSVLWCFSCCCYWCLKG